MKAKHKHTFFIFAILATNTHLLLGFVLLQMSGYYFAYIPSHSMFPALSRGDIVFMEPLRQVQREDIVTFRVEGPESQLLIKRVVGLPGDTIWADQGRVTLNSFLLMDCRVDREEDICHSAYAKLFDSYWAWEVLLTKSRECSAYVVIPFKGMEKHLEAYQREFYVQIMPDSVDWEEREAEHDYYFLMGDFRSNSVDSRYWGFLADEQLERKMRCLVWTSESI